MNTTRDPDEGLPPLRLVVLAGQGAGSGSASAFAGASGFAGGDPLAARFAESHRCLIPLAGRPLIAHVLQTAAQHPRVTSLAICVEREAFDPIWDVLTRLPGRGSVALVEAQADIAASVRAATQGWDGAVLVTTADHALLSPGAIDAMIAALESADVAFSLAPRAAVEATHPRAGRGFIALHDGDYAACDLYGMASPRFVGAVRIFGGTRAAGQDGARIRRAVGVMGMVLVRLGMETLAGALARASRRLGMRVRAVILEDGTQAIDVDDDRTYAIVRDLLERREDAARLEASAPRTAVA